MIKKIVLFSMCFILFIFVSSIGVKAAQSSNLHFTLTKLTTVGDTKKLKIKISNDSNCIYSIGLFFESNLSIETTEGTYSTKIEVKQIKSKTSKTISCSTYAPGEIKSVTIYGISEINDDFIPNLYEIEASFPSNVNIDDYKVETITNVLIVSIMIVAIVLLVFFILITNLKQDKLYLLGNILLVGAIGFLLFAVYNTLIIPLLGQNEAKEQIIAYLYQWIIGIAVLFFGIALIKKSNKKLELV